MFVHLREQLPGAGDSCDLHDQSLMRAVLQAKVHPGHKAQLCFRTSHDRCDEFHCATRISAGGTMRTGVRGGGARTTAAVRERWSFAACPCTPGRSFKSTAEYPVWGRGIL